MKHAYSIQLYSLRDTMGSDFEGTLRQVSELGYQGVEFAGFFGKTAEEVSSLLDKYALTLTGTHSSFDDLLYRYEETVAYHKAIGNRYYVIPGYDLSSQKKLDFFIENANRLFDALAKEGITLCYHNHAGEFCPNADGSVVYEQLLYRSRIMLEVDIFWAYIGMKHPLALLERVKDRLALIHLKDGLANGDGKPLGLGDAPIRAVYDYALAHALPIVVESETLTPSGLAEAKVCIECLAAFEAV